MCQGCVPEGLGDVRAPSLSLNTETDAAQLSEPEQREHWKRYDYAVVSKPLVEKGKGRGRLVDVRHLHDAFEGGRPDHLPVESCFEF